jgi:hypothetical protein
MVVRGVGVAGRDLDVTKVDACVEHGGDESVPEHVWVHPRQLDTCLVGEASQPAGGAVPVHPVAVLFAEVVDVAAGGLEDPKPEQTQHRDQGEVAPVG